MGNIYGKGDKAKATKLHSELVRSLGYCENCGHTDNLQCAHIISRRFAHTRTLFNNAFCLCAGCHRHYTDHPVEFARFVERMIGDNYEVLHALSLNRSKLFWDERLAEIKEYKGLPLDQIRSREWHNLTSND